MLNKYAKIFMCVLLSLYETPLISATKVEVAKNKDGWRLMVDGAPFFVKGMCYTPTKIGEDPNVGTMRDWMIVDDDGDGRVDAPFQSWVDKNLNNVRDADEFEVGDFKLLQQMGCNTIRVYHHASSSKEVQAINTIEHQASSNLHNHSPNKNLLRQLYTGFGIHIAMGDFLGAYTVGSGADWDAGTDYRDPAQRRNMLKSVEDMVNEFKNEPYILMWILGNENNFEEHTHTNASSHPEEYAKFVNEVARRIHELDPTHPVCLANGETKLLDVYAKYAPDVDIFGLNTYRYPGFNTLWQEVADIYDKPVLLTEFGAAHPKIENGVFDEEYQSEAHFAAWHDIAEHAAVSKSPRNAIGGFVFEWVDNWWQNWNPGEHDLGQDGWHLEWNGMASQGDGKDSPLKRHLRKVYYTYQSLWTSDKPKPRTKKDK